MDRYRHNSTFKAKGYSRSAQRKGFQYGLKRGKRLASRRPRKGKTADGDSRRAIKDECDQLVREIVRLRESKCFTCPRTESLQVGHLFRRGIESTKQHERWHR